MVVEPFSFQSAALSSPSHQSLALIQVEETAQARQPKKASCENDCDELRPYCPGLRLKYVFPTCLTSNPNFEAQTFAYIQ